MSKYIMDLGYTIVGLGRKLENTRKALSQLGFQNETEDLAGVQSKVENRIKTAMRNVDTVRPYNLPRPNQEEVNLGVTE